MTLLGLFNLTFISKYYGNSHNSFHKIYLMPRPAVAQDLRRSLENGILTQVRSRCRPEQYSGEPMSQLWMNLWRTMYSLENCILWRTVLSLEDVFSGEDCILWRTVFSGELYSLENCILRRTVFSGELYSLENCILWRTVFSGELYSLENYILTRTVFSGELYSLENCILC